MHYKKIHENKTRPGCWHRHQSSGAYASLEEGPMAWKSNNFICIIILPGGLWSPTWPSLPGCSKPLLCFSKRVENHNLDQIIKIIVD